MALRRGRPRVAPSLVVAHAAWPSAWPSAPASAPRGGVAGFLADFYPLLAVLGLYSAIGLVNAAAGVSHDAAVQGWEGRLFGAQPSRDWIRAWPHPALSWTLHVAYLSYYMTLAAAPLGLWLSGRRESARHVAFLMMLTFYLCYAVFLLFPVAGPRYVVPAGRQRGHGGAPRAPDAAPARRQRGLGHRLPVVPRRRLARGRRRRPLREWAAFGLGPARAGRAAHLRHRLRPVPLRERRPGGRRPGRGRCSPRHAKGP